MTKEEIAKYWALRRNWEAAGATYPRDYTEPKRHAKTSQIADLGAVTSELLAEHGLISACDAAAKYNISTKSIHSYIERRKLRSAYALLNNRKVRVVSEEEVISIVMKKGARKSTCGRGQCAELP